MMLSGGKICSISSNSQQMMQQRLYMVKWCCLVERFGQSAVTQSAGDAAEIVHGKMMLSGGKIWPISSNSQQMMQQRLYGTRT